MTWLMLLRVHDMTNFIKSQWYGLLNKHCMLWPMNKNIQYAYIYDPICKRCMTWPILIKLHDMTNSIKSACCDVLNQKCLVCPVQPKVHGMPFITKHACYDLFNQKCTICANVLLHTWPNLIKVHDMVCVNKAEGIMFDHFRGVSLWLLMVEL